MTSTLPTTLRLQQSLALPTSSVESSAVSAVSMKLMSWFTLILPCGGHHGDGHHLCSLRRSPSHHVSFISLQPIVYFLRRQRPPQPPSDIASTRWSLQELTRLLLPADHRWSNDGDRSHHLSLTHLPHYVVVRTMLQSTKTFETKFVRYIEWSNVQPLVHHISPIWPHYGWQSSLQRTSLQ